MLVASGAGASHDSPSFRLFKDMDLEHYDQYLRAHFLSRVYAIRAMQPHLRDAGGGSMVMIGTGAGRVATVGESLLGGSTSCMMQMYRVLAREFGREKIRVNVVAMSFISDAIPRWGGGSAALMADHGKGGMLENLRKRMLFDVTCRDIANAGGVLRRAAVRRDHRADAQRQRRSQQARLKAGVPGPIRVCAAPGVARTRLRRNRLRQGSPAACPRPPSRLRAPP